MLLAKLMWAAAGIKITPKYNGRNESIGIFDWVRGQLRLKQNKENLLERDECLKLLQKQTLIWT